MSESTEAPADPSVDENDPVAIADKPREPTEYEKRLRRENAAERVKRRAAETERDTHKQAVETAKAETAAAIERARTETRAEGNQRLIRAELKAAALAAGMVDLDGLKLLDVSGVTLSESGDVTIPDGFFDRAKAAKPYLFGAKATTSTPEPAPSAEPPAEKMARDMTAAEFSALEKRLGIRV